MFDSLNRTRAARDLLTSRDEFVVLYAGLHGLAQGLGQIIDAARELRYEDGYRFVLIGDGPHKQKLIQAANDLNLRNVTFLDPLPSTDVPGLLAAADVIAVTLGMDIPGAVPSKLYEAMASGRPVILVANGEAAEVVLKYKAGLVVQPGEISSLVQAITAMRSDTELAVKLSANARRAAVEHFDRTEIGKSFVDFLESKFSSGRIAPKERRREKATYPAPSESSQEYDNKAG